MKKIFILMMLSMIVSCKDSGPRKMGTDKPIERTSNQVKRDYDRFVYDVSGIIYSKTETTGCSKSYYFYIELEDKNVFEWETTAAKYARKKVGDPVFFEYLRKSRFSNEAL